MSAYKSLKRSFYVDKETGIPVNLKQPDIHAEPQHAAKETRTREIERSKVTFSVFAPLRAWYHTREEDQKRFMSKETRVPHSMQVEALKKK
ncbi:MAG: hypothetical protein NT001_07050, partial [Candidatus Woesearchaeota archaeon]|nr:hypothetical protein [Candidatus Woesearchaeota archaeon]